VTHRRVLLAVACVAVLVAIVAARPRSTPGPYLRDFEAYWSAGATWNSGGDPYGRAIWNAERNVAGVNAGRDEVLPFVGPPQTLLVWSVFARLPYATAAAMWTPLLAVALLTLAAAAILGAEAPLTLFTFVAALALAAGFGPATSDLALGQFAVPAFAGAAIVVLAAARSIPAATAAACLAFAQPNAALGLISQLGRNRATLALVAGAVAAYALGALAAGPAWPFAYAKALAAHAGAERWNAIQLAPAAIAYGLGATQWWATAVGAATAITAIAAAVALAFRVSGAFARFAAFSALAPFVAGFFHEHDLIVAYAAAVWCALRTRGVERIVALAGTVLVAVDWLGLAQRPSGFAQSALLAVAVAAAFAALGERADLRGAAAVTVCAGALFAIAAIAAAHAPAPVWPDALGSFHAPAAMPIAAVWAAEQRATGLFAPVPVWALLRSLSLLGCGLLAYAIYRHPSCCRTA
jgi:hypothetical protein